MLIPQGSPPVRGLEAIDRFWWPKNGLATTVTGFTVTVDEIGGSGNLGFVRGSFVLDFFWEDKGKTVSRRNRGNSLMLLRRSAAGEWRISHRMWGDLPR